MLVDNFLGGITWSIGVWVGTTIVVALFVFVLSKMNLVPFIGEFVSAVSDYVTSANPHR